MTLHERALEYARDSECEDGGAYDGFKAGARWLVARIQAVLERERWPEDKAREIELELDAITSKEPA